MCGTTSKKKQPLVENTLHCFPSYFNEEFNFNALLLKGFNPLDSFLNVFEIFTRFSTDFPLKTIFSTEEISERSEKRI